MHGKSNGVESAPTRGSFKELIAVEHARIAEGRRADPKTTAEHGHVPEALEVSTKGSADEPWVTFTAHDYFGLALSGGGIRSATFNLGLLQALEEHHLLEHVDYLSTVSGGGYIGGFWTAWLHNERKPQEGQEARRPSTFPVVEQRAASQGGFALETREAPQIRHLREFSRFLMPRVGFRYGETWAGIVAVLGGILPSLSAGLAVLALAFYAWCAASAVLVYAAPGLRWLIFGSITLVWQGVAEYFWQAAGKHGSKPHWDVCYWPLALVTAAAAGLMFQSGLEAVGLALEPPSQLSAVELAGTAFYGTWTFTLPIAWGLTALGLLLLRLVFVRLIAKRERLVRWSSAFDRVVARLVAPALVIAAIGLLWHIAGALIGEKTNVKPSEGHAALGTTLGGSVTLTGLFVWLRDWLSKPPEKTRGSELLDWLVPRLKLVAPQVLANGAVALALLATAMIILRSSVQDNLLFGVTGAASVVLFVVVTFDPARVGLHDFYRSRIARGFLGASLARSNEPVKRATTEQPEDDFTFQDIANNENHKRPIHLVCCAANGIAGDVLGTLYRGARSAVVSPLGISLGDHFAAPPTDLRLSSALTASAAAFNSQMGSYSMKLGPAVAFLMSALNLRLGLWLPHPLRSAKQSRRLFPGVHFFLEMLGQTRSGPVESEGLLPHTAKSIHLSDGGHFENLGLYELVRRRCRYVIVSDCGADPDVTFDDLGNALRRVREDFGVEIELDTSPLRPNADGRSRQHAVMGTIHYNGLGGSDKGMLLYFKPNLSGDEPPDVLQYCWRNRDFPHQSTADQFYDEAQWESYRRLGAHAVHSVLRPLENSTSRGHAVNRLFMEASQRWHAELDKQDDIFLALTERCAQIESDLRENAPAFLRAEFFPEVQAALGPSPAPTGAITPPLAAPTPDETTKTLYFLMLVIQVMEDAWVGAELETLWSHPLNEGWMNYFQRWASTPSFRRWWPILRPIYSPGFRDFVRDRFELRVIDPRRDPPGPGCTLTLVDLHQGQQDGTLLEPLPRPLDGHAWQQRSSRSAPPSTDGKRALVYQLTLEGGATSQPIQVGFLLYTSSADKQVVEWHASDMFVPPALIGAGIVARFLDAIIESFRGSASKLRVVLDQRETDATGKKTPPRRDTASRRARVHDISFYKSRGFIYSHLTEAGDPRVLELALSVRN
jgi:hypothetical protein